MMERKNVVGRLYNSSNTVFQLGKMQLMSSNSSWEKRQRSNWSSNGSRKYQTMSSKFDNKIFIFWIGENGFKGAFELLGGFKVCVSRLYIKKAIQTNILHCISSHENLQFTWWGIQSFLWSLLMRKFVCSLELLATFFKFWVFFIKNPNFEI